jgi:hypothetical protein
MSLPITELLVIAVLTLIEAVFVAAEIALVSIRRSRVEQLVEEGVGGATRVRHLLDEPGRFLAVVQVGVTFVGFLASAYAAVSLTRNLENVLATVPVLHDCLRRARPEVARARPPRAVRAVAVGAGRPPGPPPSPDHRAAHRRDRAHHAVARREHPA